jgi:hypothetical protein
MIVRENENNRNKRVQKESHVSGMQKEASKI